jgi:hypothetical protein
MKALVVLLVLCLSCPVYAKKDGNAMMREVYASLWKPVILHMFADAGPTTVKLVKKKLVIVNAYCDNKDVRTALSATFAPAKEKLKEIDMCIECVKVL